MPEMKNARTGAVISCSDATAARLSGEWQPVGQAKPPAAEKAAPRKRSPQSTDE